jgi:hypothetical protein
MCPHANICQAQRKRTLRSAGILLLFWRDRGRCRYTQFPGFTGTKVRILTQLLQEATRHYYEALSLWDTPSLPRNHIFPSLFFAPPCIPCLENCCRKRRGTIMRRCLSWILGAIAHVPACTRALATLRSCRCASVTAA